MPLLVSGKTDIGMKRKSNQDSICLNIAERFFIVADGMGGHNGGDIASQMAIQVIAQKLTALDSDRNYPEQSLLEAIQACNEAIFSKSKNEVSLQGMGTTTVAMLFHEKNLYIANVGDSRAYLVNQSKIFQLTKDHSLVQEKIDRQIYTRDIGQADTQKNVLLRSVGFEQSVDIDIFTYQVLKGDIFLLCSDGLHGKIRDEDILALINQFIPDPKNTDQATLDKLVHSLIAQANANGGQDNISVICIVAR